MTAAGSRRSRTTPVLGALAGLFALWLGLSAPATSPVAPTSQPASIAVVAAPAIDPGADAAPEPVVGQQSRDGDRGADGDPGRGRGRGRR